MTGQIKKISITPEAVLGYLLRDMYYFDKGKFKAAWLDKDGVLQIVIEDESFAVVCEGMEIPQADRAKF